MRKYSLPPILLLITFFVTFFVTSCGIISKPRVEGTNLNGGKSESYFLVQSAESCYAKGVMCNLQRKWDCARESFDSSLAIISALDLEKTDEPELQHRVGILLREIAYDYRYTLLSSGFPGSANAPAVISFALEESLADGELSKLVDALPKIEKPVEYDFPVEWNNRVKEKLVYIVTDLKKPFQLWLNSSGKYMDMIREIFIAEGLPTDLAYLPLVESGYNPRAYSWAHAVGVWQFISATGRKHGLRVDWWVDERRDPVKSTYAAAKYLKFLYNKFNDWPLALAAYNCGESRVARQIKKQGTSSFWWLELPRQTRNYVPLFMAALMVAKQSELFGFNPQPHPPFQFDTVSVGPATDLRIVSKTLGIGLDSLRSLNPELMRWATPPDVKNYCLRIPLGSHESFATAFAKIPSQKRKADFIEHKVRRGETLSHIAKYYHTSISAIATTNSIRNKHKLRIGQKLLIPLAARSARSTAKTRGHQATSGGKYYTVKRGDNLSTIASKSNVKVNDLCKWNKIGKKSLLHPGQKLIVSSAPKRETVSTKRDIKKDIVHSVKRGDSLYKIARKYKVSIDDILFLNDIPDKNVPLRIGQKLTVQKATKNKITYTVKAGNSLSEIARQYGVSVRELRDWNSLKGNLIRTGQKLVIYEDSKQNSKGKVVVHKVKTGETLWKIASVYGLSIDDIMKQNKGLEPKKLRVGEEITLWLSN